MTNMTPSDPDDDLGTVHYTWLANNTCDWAAFVRSFVRSCAAHREYRVRHAPALTGRQGGLQAADTLFDGLRLRYLSVVQKAQGPYHRPPYKDIATILPRMPDNELAFDRAIYDIFFGGPRAADRPQQVAQRLLPHCDRLNASPSIPMLWIETPAEKLETASVLRSIETVADAVEKVAQRVRARCKEHDMNLGSLPAVTELSDHDDDDDDDDVDYHLV
jgi:hypothetical protein